MRMTKPEDWSEHTKFKVTLGTLVSGLLVVIGSVWGIAVIYQRTVDEATRTMRRMEKHLENDWTLREEIVHFKNTKIANPELVKNGFSLLDPKETWEETHPEKNGESRQ